MNHTQTQPAKLSVPSRELPGSRSIGRYARSGAVAGVASALLFTIVHGLLISDIWFALIALVVAGAACGLCLGWSYALLVASPSLGGWIRYNLLYLAMFLVLGAASVLVFEPVTTLSAVIAANAAPDELIRQAMPMTAAFTVATAALVSLLYAKNWTNFGAIFLTCSVLILSLGLNVSTIGLVDIPRGSLYLIAEMFGLILLLIGVFVVAFIGLERHTLSRRTTNL
jgi:hypothetical protein